MLYWVAHVFFVLVSKFFFPVSVAGLRNIPRRGPCILASNHISNLDPFLVGLASSRRLNYLAKESLFKNKILRFLLYRVGAFPIKRESSDTSALKEALRRLKTGRKMLIFPEGTRKGEVSQKKTQPGIGFLALKSKAVVIPTFIKGSDKVLAVGAKFLKPGRIQVNFGKAIEYSSADTYQDIANKIMKEIYSLSEAA